MKNKRMRSRGGIRAAVAAAVLLGLTGGTPIALAQDDGGPSVADPAAEAPAAEAPAAEAPAAGAETPKTDESPEVGSNADLVAKLKAAKKAHDELKKARDDDQDPVKFAWAGLIAAFANLLLSGVKRAMKLTGKAKKILPKIAVGLGAIAAIAMHYGAGMSIFDSILYGGAAAGAIVLQELGIGIKSADSKADG